MAYETTKPKHQLRVPFVRKGIGLGDVVAAATKAVGIQPCEPCKKRQEALNRWLQVQAWKARQK